MSEYRFHPVRKFRFDFCYPDLKIAIEAEGGTWARRRGAHVSGVGYRDDCIKYNLAALMGYIVLRFTSDMIRDDSFLEYVVQAIKIRSA